MRQETLSKKHFSFFYNKEFLIERQTLLLSKRNGFVESEERFFIFAAKKSPQAWRRWSLREQMRFFVEPKNEKEVLEEENWDHFICISWLLRSFCQLLSTKKRAEIRAGKIRANSRAKKRGRVCNLHWVSFPNSAPEGKKMPEGVIMRVEEWRKL